MAQTALLGMRPNTIPTTHTDRLTHQLRRTRAQALGGTSVQESLLFFHLKPDGSAGLLSTEGGWKGGPYTPLQAADRHCGPMCTVNSGASA